MVDMFRYFCMVVVAIVVVGCVDFVQPKLGQPAAQLEITSAKKGAFDANVFGAFDADPCLDKGARLRNLTAGLDWVSTGRQSLRVAPGTPLFLYGKYQLFAGVQMVVNGAVIGKTDSCVSVASFLPEVSHKYRLVQNGSLTNCDLQVVDLATGEVAEGFRLHDVNACLLETR